MPFQMFHDLFPKIANAETRTITVTSSRSHIGLPRGSYGFCEMFCNERGCDCRRVFFYVMASFRKEPQAVIAWGWESAAFYAKWLGHDDPETISALKGPILNSLSPQTELAPPLLDLVRNVLLRDEAYVERIKRHYRLFRARIASSPATRPKFTDRKSNKRRKPKRQKPRSKRRRR